MHERVGVRNKEHERPDPGARQGRHYKRKARPGARQKRPDLGLDKKGQTWGETRKTRPGARQKRPS